MRWYTLFTLVAAALFCSRPASAAADSYEFDKAHSHVLFYVNHLGFSDMLGMFTKYDGTLKFDPDHPEQSSLDVTLFPSGIHTTSELLDTILQGSNFFNTEQFPEIRFVSTSSTITGKNTGDIAGNLTMLGVTKPLTLHVKLNKADYQPVTNLFVAGFHATATLKRSDFGMSYSIPLVSDEVRIEIETEAVDIDRKNSEKLKH